MTVVNEIILLVFWLMISMMPFGVVLLLAHAGAKSSRICRRARPAGDVVGRVLPGKVFAAVTRRIGGGAGGQQS